MKSRMMKTALGGSLTLAIGMLLLPATRAEDGKALAFRVHFAKSVTAEPFTGRVYVMVSKQPFNDMPGGPNWFRPEPMFATDVRKWHPGEELVLGADAIAHPTPLHRLSEGKYHAVAVMDFDKGDISFTRAAGNAYSKSVEFDASPAKRGPVELEIDQIYQPSKFRESDQVKLVDIESKLLSTFHHRPVRLRAAVMLPASFAKNETKRYPVVYEIPGFGGTHFSAQYRNASDRTDVAGTEMLWVVLDPSCRLGHHVFADSDNNGPCGKALVEELIPEIEKRFRGLAVPAARFVTGHSSGGWSSLWLQVAYPDFFGGVWSTAPDPVDFRDFQQINLYQPNVNMFTDDAGKARPLARRGTTASIFYKDFSDMEVVMGHGGQLGSFEAVFSPRGSDGKPMELWNRKTGAVDPAVARSWERYDIRLVLERNWKTLSPKLAGKLHVYMGGQDTFYLEGATKLLKASLEGLGSDAMVEIFPGKDHGSLMDRNLRSRISKEMAEQFKKNAGGGLPPRN